MSRNRRRKPRNKEEKKYLIEKIVNEDGTECNYPENPLKEKWAKLYPPNQRYGNGENCHGYSCMFCGLCPYGSHWEVPEEDKELWEQYKKEINEYNKIHNPWAYSMTNKE